MGEPDEASRARASWYAWLKRMAMESTKLSMVADDSRAMEPSVVIGRPGW